MIILKGKVKMEYQYKCTNCGRTFSGKNDFDVEYTRDQHYTYCCLKRIHKVMQIVLFPLTAIGLIVLLIGGITYFTLAPIAYPFMYAINLFLDNKIYTFKEFNKDVYGEDRVKSWKIKHSK
jgi:DNA-directed RNA polymerase subunit RPC12/RpoP